MLMKNCVAICGTSFSNFHFLKLAKYTDKITFVLDNDDAGNKSMEKIYQKYSNKGIKLRFFKLPNEYKDVDEAFSSKLYNKKELLDAVLPVVPGIW